MYENSQCPAILDEAAAAVFGGRSNRGSKITSMHIGVIGKGGSMALYISYVVNLYGLSTISQKILCTLSGYFDVLLVHCV